MAARWKEDGVPFPTRYGSAPADERVGGEGSSSVHAPGGMLHAWALSRVDPIMLRMQSPWPVPTCDGGKVRQAVCDVRSEGSCVAELGRVRQAE